MKPWREEEPPTPRDTPNARRPESLLPARALPSLFSAGAFVSAANLAALEIQEPTRRALVLILCGLLTWLVGYFTPPPRRRFRRGDRS